MVTSGWGVRWWVYDGVVQVNDTRKSTHKVKRYINKSSKFIKQIDIRFEPA